MDCHRISLRATERRRVGDGNGETAGSFDAGTRDHGLDEPVTLHVPSEIGPKQRFRRTMAFIFGAIYVVLLITLGILSIRKGHWVMFVIGLFIPLFWVIGALLPRREPR